jgi:hypothetical protein
VGSVEVLTGLTAATGLEAGAVPDGDGDGFLLGDGLAEAAPVTVTVPDVTGSAAMAGLTAAFAVAVSVTEVTDELAVAGTAIWACIA